MVRHTLFTATVVLLTACAQAESALRGASETWRLLSESEDAPVAAQPLQEKSFDWIQNNSNTAAFYVEPSGKIGGDQAILVFHDRTIDAVSKAEAALVSFDVRSKANCVVSVCGTFRKWYMGESEQCWGLTVAPKSSNPEENGVIRGISAAYTASRPVAKKLYLKFDAVNYIDGSVCEYEVLSGSKTVTTEDLTAQQRV